MKGIGTLDQSSEKHFNFCRERYSKKVHYLSIMGNFLSFFLISFLTLSSPVSATHYVENIKPKIYKTSQGVDKMSYVIEFYSKDVSKPTLVLDPKKQNIYYIGSGGIYYEFKENINYKKIIQFLPQYEFKKFTDDINEVVEKIKETGEMVIMYDNEINFWYPAFDEIVVKQKQQDNK